MVDSLEAARIFELTCELDADARRSALDELDLAPEVRARVERLLSIYDRTDAGVDLEPLGSVLVEPGRRYGRFVVERLLGEGGMGIVYRARDAEGGGEVALKVLRATFGSPELRRRFRREAEVLRRLEHPGICRYLAAGEREDPVAPELYLAMELVEGQPLTEHAATRALSDAARLELMARVCDAVQYAHEQGVVHRDLKPSNVLIVDGQGAEGVGAPKVLDFGVARVTSHALDSLTLTRSGSLLGTAAYMSPEQSSGEQDAVTARSDVYSLGVLLFELLSGELPYPVTGLPVGMVARVIQEEEPARLSSVVERLRGPLDAVLAKALEKDPAHRYATAAELADDLRRYLRGERVAARPPTVRRQLMKLARQNRAAASALLATIGALSIGGAVASYLAVTNARLARREADARADADLEARAARRMAELAEARLVEIRERADPDRLRVAEEIAQDLWPALPRTIPRIERWLRRRAEPLQEGVEAHERALAELRARALPYSEEDRRRDREEHPLVPELEEARRQLAYCERQLAGEDPNLPAPTERELGILRDSIELVEGRIAALEAAIGARRTWRLEDPALQERHDHLAQLVADLRAFFDPEHGVYQDVLGRLAEAGGIEERTVGGPEPAAEWRAALASIRELDVYAGLELEPQVGLRPLHQDPWSGLWEFWHVPSGERPLPQDDPDGLSEWRLEEGTGLVFVLIPGGTAQLGAQSKDPRAPNYDPAALPGEGPVRTEELEPFFLSKYELTQAQWARMAEENPSTYGETFTWMGIPARSEPITWNDWTNPVETVKWTDATRVLAAYGLRLPSESEWEYAARAGTDTPYWTGTTVASLQELSAANLADGAVRRQGGPAHWPYEEELSDSWLAHAPAGTFAPNPFGLHDVLGNVWEWCADEPAPGRVVARGGGYEHGGGSARVTHREYTQPSASSRFVGLRPARPVE